MPNGHSMLGIAHSEDSSSPHLLLLQAITRSRAANSKKEIETKANQQTTTTTSECFMYVTKNIFRI